MACCSEFSSDSAS
jgi:hypothetical protein